MSVGPRAENFNIVSNDHGPTHKYDFSIFGRKYPYGPNLVKKKKQKQKTKLSRNLKFGTQNNSNLQNSVW